MRIYDIAFATAQTIQLPVIFDAIALMWRQLGAILHSHLATNPIHVLRLGGDTASLHQTGIDMIYIFKIYI